MGLGEMSGGPLQLSRSEAALGATREKRIRAGRMIFLCLSLLMRRMSPARHSQSEP